MNSTIYRDSQYLVMPGMATAHSHAFQRALRGRTQRRSMQAGSFWSWRGLMYDLAEKLDPDDIFNISRFAFAELAMSGVTAVGEFHYVHHAPGGTPYADRLTLAESVIHAALEVGIRITLIRTAYRRAGYQKSLASAQERFCDPNADLVMADVESLLNRYQDNSLVEVAIAAHSIRAVERHEVIDLAQFAKDKNLPFHMHIAEQQGEIAESLAEYGQRPVEMLAEEGVLNARFVGVHATHLNASETQSTVCLCRTTERDLGDGLPQTADLWQAGVKLCVGVDSHATSDGFEEVRAVELDDRSRTEARHVVTEAPELLQIATINGYSAIGMSAVAGQDKVYLNANDASIADAQADMLVDAVIFGATPRSVDKVMVSNKTIVEHGLHVDYETIRANYLKTLGKLGLGVTTQVSEMAFSCGFKFS